jgi:hypothetical protein
MEQQLYDLPIKNKIKNLAHHFLKPQQSHDNK